MYLLLYCIVLYYILLYVTYLHILGCVYIHSDVYYIYIYIYVYICDHMCTYILSMFSEIWFLTSSRLIHCFQDLAWNAFERCDFHLVQKGLLFDVCQGSSLGTVKRLMRWTGQTSWYIVHSYYTYITLHYITLHYITLHYTTLHYTTLHYTTLHTYIHTYIYYRHVTRIYINKHNIYI